jgi:hypothetical protein
MSSGRIFDFSVTLPKGSCKHRHNQMCEVNSVDITRRGKPQSLWAESMRTDQGKICQLMYPLDQ